MDLLSTILSQLRLAGTLYFRTELTSPWGVKVPSHENVARFHYAHRGGCFVRVEGVDVPIALKQGDFLIIPWGAPHTLYCDPKNEPDAAPLETVLNDSGFTGTGALVYGATEGTLETQLVCGHFAFGDHVSHPLITQLPPVIHIPDYGETAGSWMEQTLRLIGAEAGRDQLGGDLIALKLAEIIFAQVLRIYLQSDGRARLVFAAFADPKIQRALAAVHTAPEQDWSVEDLASRAGMSRTAFANTFATRMGMTPMAYVTEWRLQIARQSLMDKTQPLIDLAESVGYGSEAAFSRAFKRRFDLAPARYRREYAA